MRHSARRAGATARAETTANGSNSAYLYRLTHQRRHLVGIFLFFLSLSHKHSFAEHMYAEEFSRGGASESACDVSTVVVMVAVFVGGGGGISNFLVVSLACLRVRICISPLPSQFFARFYWVSRVPFFAYYNLSPAWILRCLCELTADPGKRPKQERCQSLKSFFASIPRDDAKASTAAAVAVIARETVNDDGGDDDPGSMGQNVAARASAHTVCILRWSVCCVHVRACM